MERARSNNSLLAGVPGRLDHQPAAPGGKPALHTQQHAAQLLRHTLHALPLRTCTSRTNCSVSW